MFGNKKYVDDGCPVKFIKTNSTKLIDEAWDLFSEFIGETGLQTPLSLEQFELGFRQINKDQKFSGLKADILCSFRNDSYMWPLVEREGCKGNSK